MTKIELLRQVKILENNAKKDLETGYNPFIDGQVDTFHDIAKFIGENLTIEMDEILKHLQEMLQYQEACEEIPDLNWFGVRGGIDAYATIIRFILHDKDLNYDQS